MAQAPDWNSRIGSRIKLRDLHILQVAAEAGSMAKAAATLAVTQPAVSYAVAAMEHALGVPLLDRTSHGVTPTVYGHALLGRAHVVFNELRQGVSEIQSLADPGAGELHIGTTPPMSAIASAVFNSLIARYPRMTFNLTVAGTDDLLQALRQRDVELVISRLADFVTEGDLQIDTLFHDELAVICSKRSKWGRQRGVALADLVGEPWVFPASKGFLTKVIRTAFEEHGLEIPRAAVITQSTYALSILVSNGPFLAMHPGAMLTTPSEHPQLTAVDVRLRNTRAPIGLITLKSRSLSPVAKVFLRAAQDVAKSIPRAGTRQPRAKQP